MELQPQGGFQHYWQAIREKVCVVCMHGDGKGNCNLPAVQQCALKVFFPDVVMNVVNARTDSYERSLDVMRRHVCILCDFQQSDMKCQLRDEQSCALDRYHPLIVDTIKSVEKQLEDTESKSAMT